MAEAVRKKMKMLVTIVDREKGKDAVHDNRMFAERTFYCIASGVGEQ